MIFPGAALGSQAGGEFIAVKPEGFATTVTDGKRRRVYWATSPLTGWKFVLNTSEDEIFVPVRQLTLRSTLIGLAGLVVLVVVVSIIARRLSNPLLDLTHTAAAIERGDFREENIGQTS